MSSNQAKKSSKSSCYNPLGCQLAAKRSCSEIHCKLLSRGDAVFVPLVPYACACNTGYNVRAQKCRFPIVATTNAATRDSL